VLAPRTKAKANQRHNSLSRHSVSITAHSLSPARAIQPMKRCSMKRKSDISDTVTILACAKTRIPTK